MEATGVMFGQPLRFPYAAGGVRPESRELGSSSSLNFAIGSSGFRDRGHVRYYNSVVASSSSAVTASSSKAMSEVKAAKKMKKKQLKLLKGLFRDLTRFSQMGFGLRSDQDRDNMISEASELLLKQLEKVKAEGKQLKQKMKEEKARLKAEARSQIVSSSSLESSSSDSECGEIVQMNDLTKQAIDEATTLAYPVPIIPTAAEEERPSSCNDAENEKTRLKKIEVCMGGKCKKSGAGALLEEFQRVIGVDGAVTGCKCMGKCRDGPNVKVSDAVDGSLGSKSLCLGVGLEDVDMIVGSFLGSHVGLAGSC